MECTVLVFALYFFFTLASHISNDNLLYKVLELYTLTKQIKLIYLMKEISYRPIAIVVYIILFALNYLYSLDPEIIIDEEAKAIEQGKLDYITLIQPTKSLACVTFVKADYQSLQILYNNMNFMKGYCDWIVIFYDGTDELIKDFCDNIVINNIASFNSTTKTMDLKTLEERQTILYQSNAFNITLCKRASVSMNPTKIAITLPNGEIIKQLKSIPKSVLYQEIVDTIPSYEMTFIMDEDISLDGFSYTRFIALWKCSFVTTSSQPLIVQPLIAERTQYFPYVYEKIWRLKRFSNIIATTVGLVEQQVPFFNTVFLVWYIRHVLSRIKDVALKYGVDQSIDKTWCKAADMYAREVLNHKLINNNSMCAVIIATPPVHHKNLRSLSNKRTNRKLYRQRAQKVNAIYQSLFPTWVLDDITRKINPLDRKYGKDYKILTSTNKTCLKQYHQ